MPSMWYCLILVSDMRLCSVHYPSLDVDCTVDCVAAWAVLRSSFEDVPDYMQAVLDGKINRHDTFGAVLPQHLL